MLSLQSTMALTLADFAQVGILVAVSPLGRLRIQNDGHWTLHNAIWHSDTQITEFVM